VAPLTRMRAEKNGVPNDLMVEYYSQRAGFGLIFTECTPISKRAESLPGAGGIYTDEHVEGWKKVTDAVHEKGGKIAL